jgi:DNA polymerase III subunit beta
MKFSVEQDVLAKALNLVGKGVSIRSTLPALSGVYMDLMGDELTLMGNNTEVALRVMVKVRGEEEGLFLAPARLLTDFVVSLPAGLMSVDTTNEKMKIKVGKQASDFTGLNLEEYPEVNFEMQETRYTFPVKEFGEAIERVSFAASSDEARAILTGVAIKAEKGQLEMAATDGFRLSVEKFQSEVLDKSFSAVVPAKVINELGKTVRESRGDNAGIFECALSKERTQLIFKIGERDLFMTRLLEGTFPPYNKIIPNSYATRVAFDVAELLRTVRTAALFARSGALVVKMMIVPSEKVVRLSSATEQVGEYSGEMNAEIEGSENVIAFNSKYLLDFLGRVKGEQVVLELNGVNQPGVWKVVGQESFLHVIMPIKLD